MPQNRRKTPEERFRIVAVKRANRIIEDLRRLASCASPKYYAYRKEDVEAIFQRIDEAVSASKSSFSQKKFERVKL